RRLWSASQRLDDEVGGLAAAVVLLAGDEVAVADREASPEPRLDVVGAEGFELVLDAPGHDVLVFVEGAHVPHGLVGGVLLDVGKASDGFARDQWLAVGEAGGKQKGPPLAQGRRGVAGPLKPREIGG